MSKGLSYMFSGTRGQLVNTISTLPQKGGTLVKNGWKDISPTCQANLGHFTCENPDTGLRVRFDSKRAGAQGFSGKDHYHVLNPKATGNKDMYLDKNGNPVARGSKASHILPKGAKK